MYKHATYKTKIEDINEFIPAIIEVIKKDLKNEHLKKHPQFVKKFFNSTNINKLTTEDLCQAYIKAIKEEANGEDIGEFVSARWLLKNSEMYAFFEKELTQLVGDFTSLEEIDSTKAQQLINDSIAQFGPLNTYLFAVLNSVVFPESHFHALKQEAQKELQTHASETYISHENANSNKIRMRIELDINRLKDKYEKKLAGLQKKYVVDTEALKKQIALLQRKLHTHGL